MSPEEYGKIVSAALLYNNCIYIGKDGHHVIFTMEPIGVLKTAKQGFVTEYGYFVDRELGLILAEYFEQIDYKYPPLDRLNSEDLKKDDLKVKRFIKTFNYKEKK